MADVDWARGGGLQALGQGDEVQGLPPDARQGEDLDAVTVIIPTTCTPHVALAAMQLGKHVYVEKPLTRTPWEARLLTDAAAKYKVATQMGNQGIHTTPHGWRRRLSGRARSATSPKSIRSAAAPAGRRGCRRFPPPSVCRHARLGPVAGPAPRRDRSRLATTPTAAVQAAVRLLPAVQLARVLRFRQQPDR